MPELPDVTVYLEALERRILGARLERVRLLTPFVLRSVDPPLSAAAGKAVVGFRRLGKRIVIALEDDLFLVIHLMIAGRLHWKPGRRPPAGQDRPGRVRLLDRHADPHRGRHQAARLAARRARRGGAARARPGRPRRLRRLARRVRRTRCARENHTLKRALTDPRLFSGIGNAYSDEILHRARLSPVKLSQSLDADEVRRLWEATRTVLAEWIERLRQEAGEDFPENVTAFRPDMAVHGRYGKPCPDCGAPVQRIVYADNETNYCARCQTGGRLLADRSLSRLLQRDWPKTVDEWEARRRPAR